MHKAILANVEIAGAGAASPIVRIAAGKIFLEPINPAIAVLAVGFDLTIDALFAPIQRLHRTTAVVNDT